MLTRQDFDVNSFEFWSKILRIKGVNLQNCSARTILNLFNIKGPNSFIDGGTQTDSSILDNRIKELEHEYVEIREQNKVLKQEKLEDLENIKKLQKLEKMLEDRINDLKSKKFDLECNLEAKEKEIFTLNTKIVELRTEADVRKEEFNKQRKKLDSLAKNFNEMKMERAKLQRKINREFKNRGGDNESQSCASLSEDSDEERQEKQNKKKLKHKKKSSVLDEIREDEILLNTGIIPIQESDNEEDAGGHGDRHYFNRGTTTVSRELGRLDIDDDESISSEERQERSSIKNSKVTSRQDSSQNKDFARMGTFKSDSSQNSTRFKFKPKKLKCNAFIQTDKQIFQQYIDLLVSQIMKQSKASKRNKTVQTEEVVSQVEQVRRQELLASYGHKIYSSGDVAFRGFSRGENNEIKYSGLVLKNNSKADKHNDIIAQSIQLISPTKPSKPKNINNMPVINEFLQIVPKGGAARKSFNSKGKIDKQSSNPRTTSEDDQNEQNVSSRISKGRNLKMRKKNTSQNLNAVSLKMENIIKSLESEKDIRVLFRSKDSKEDSGLNKLSLSKNSDNKSVIKINEMQNSQNNSKIDDSLDEN